MKNPAGNILFSAALIVKNEEKVLTRCLASIKKVVDEIVVVDTGSTDRTKAIAKEFGAKVFDHVWQDDFSIARNISLDHCLGKWILQIDADEELYIDPNIDLRDALEKTSADVLNIMMVDSRNPNIRPLPRIFRNIPELKFKNEIHEYIDMGSKSDIKIAMTNVRIIHYGYGKDVIEEKNKHKRNLELLEQSYQRDKNNPTTLYHYGLECKIMRKYKKAIKLFEMTLKQDDEYLSALSVPFLAECYDAIGDADKALEIIEDGTRRFPLYIDLRFRLGTYYLKAGNYKKALSYFEDCLALGTKPSMYPEIPEVGGVISLLFYGYCLFSLGEQARAQKLFERVMADLKNNAVALSYLSNVLTNIEGKEAAKTKISQIANLQNEGVRKLVTLHFPDL